MAQQRMVRKAIFFGQVQMKVMAQEGSVAQHGLHQKVLVVEKELPGAYLRKEGVT